MISKKYFKSWIYLWCVKTNIRIYIFKLNHQMFIRSKSQFTLGWQQKSRLKFKKKLSLINWKEVNLSLTKCLKTIISFTQRLKKSLMRYKILQFVSIVQILNQNLRNLFLKKEQSYIWRDQSLYNLKIQKIVP